MIYAYIPSKFLINFHNAIIAINKTTNVNDLYRSLHDDLKNNMLIIHEAMRVTNNPSGLYNILPFYYKKSTEVAEAAINRQLQINLTGLQYLYDSFPESIQQAPVILAKLGLPNAPQGRKLF